MTRRREEIKLFCRDFLQGNHHSTLHGILEPYRQRFAEIDIKFTTEDTFVESFRSICYDTFKQRSTQQGYVIAILGFAENIHKSHHCISSWYNIGVMIVILKNLLDDIADFHPDQFKKTESSSLCILL